MFVKIYNWLVTSLHNASQALDKHTENAEINYRTSVINLYNSVKVYQVAIPMQDGYIDKCVDVVLNCNIMATSYEALKNVYALQGIANSNIDFLLETIENDMKIKYPDFKEIMDEALVIYNKYEV